MTPLILATKKKSEQLLNVLIHAGVDVDAQSKDVSNMLYMPTTGFMYYYHNTHREIR